MTKKDYVLIARALDAPSCELMEAGVYELVAKSLANALETDNTKFDRKRFLKACGVEEK